MSVRQAASLLSVVVILLTGTTLIAVFQGPKSLVPVLVATLVLVHVVQYFVSRCPRCGKSALIEHLLGEETWFRRRVLVMYRAWPEKTCSRCGLDLSTSSLDA